MRGRHKGSPRPSRSTRCALQRGGGGRGHTEHIRTVIRAENQRKEQLEVRGRLGGSCGARCVVSGKEGAVPRRPTGPRPAFGASPSACPSLAVRAGPCSKTTPLARPLRPFRFWKIHKVRTRINDLCLQDRVAPHNALAQLALLRDARDLARPVAVRGCKLMIDEYHARMSRRVCSSYDCGSSRSP